MSTTIKSESEPELKCTKPRRPAGIIRYKGLPSGWKKSNRYWYYGWAARYELFQEYLSETKRPFPRHKIAIVPTAISYMRHDTGFHNIHSVLGKPDAESAAKGVVTQDERGSMVHLAVISCTRSQEAYMYRPEPEQMQLLIDIFEEEPRWFEDFYIKKESDENQQY